MRALQTCAISTVSVHRPRKPYHTKKRNENLKRPYELIEEGTVRRSVLCMSDGFGYLRYKETPKSMYWKCRIFRDGVGCRAKAILDKRSGDFFVTVPHTCTDPDFVPPSNSRGFKPL